MNQNETQWDKLLKIRTTGRDDSHADQYRYPYEPTPYCVLERLANSGMIGSKIRYWIMGQGKGASVFICPIRPGAGQWESNTMSGFFRELWKTGRWQYPVHVPAL